MFVTIVNGFNAGQLGDRHCSRLRITLNNAINNDLNCRKTKYAIMRLITRNHHDFGAAIQYSMHCLHHIFSQRIHEAHHPAQNKLTRVNSTSNCQHPVDMLVT